MRLKLQNNLDLGNYHVEDKNLYIKCKRRAVLRNSFKRPTGWFTRLCCSVSRAREVLPQKNCVSEKPFFPASLSLALSLSTPHNAFDLHLAHWHLQSSVYGSLLHVRHPSRWLVRVSGEPGSNTSEKSCLSGLLTSVFLASVDLRF